MYAIRSYYEKELFEDIIYPNVTYYDDFITTYKIFAKANKVVVSTAENYCLVLNKVYFKNKITDSDRMKKIGSCFDIRITSYNVCYTKLLRMAYLKCLT